METDRQTVPLRVCLCLCVCQRQRRICWRAHLRIIHIWWAADILGMHKSFGPEWKPRLWHWGAAAAAAAAAHAHAYASSRVYRDCLSMHISYYLHFESTLHSSVFLCISLLFLLHHCIHRRLLSRPFGWMLFRINYEHWKCTNTFYILEYKSFEFKIALQIAIIYSGKGQWLEIAHLHEVIFDWLRSEWATGNSHSMQSHSYR